mmetsp:Transcript_20845/g.25556  ORF Transcript_20845/g.25556 Transcript_20845/m.25556 type:complete len:261 (-) Transcript_20845:209-991(-)|eukprot:CAMPEP_0170465686 /NCGR_PEP_ID=MMETSP0123-20130129/9938_1 /TAXON_ID=182087 /ORGANISM="Favella ehrenbergii, Strain Fehren 1" /LENGTH=260 /DNA_ID=CAMNT_0010731647 /DNA_START=41 /DNA_END=823 /DNA_ORIENTATION=-
MEVKGAEQRTGTVFLYEMLGTALFIYGIMLTNNPVSIAFSLFASIMIFGAVTGGHFNPAVTLGVYISEGKYSENASWLAIVWCAQVLGGLLGWGLCELTLFGDKLGSIPEGDVAILCPQDPTNTDASKSVCDGAKGFNLDFQVLANEILLTAVFVSVILMVKGGAKTTFSADGAAGALAIVLVLLGCIKTGGKLGGCLNPAVGLTLSANQTMHLDNSDGIYSHYTYAYILGPLLGGALAGGFALLHRPHFDDAGKAQKAA